MIWKETPIMNARFSLFQKLLNTLDEHQDDFSQSLRRNVSRRLIQRRGIASRVLRYLRPIDENGDTLQQRFLAEYPEECAAAAKKLISGENSIGEEILKHCVLWLKMHPADLESPRAASAKKFCDSLMAVHNDFAASGSQSLFPKSLVAKLKMVVSTSVPSERVFSKARHLRRSLEIKTSMISYSSKVSTRALSCTWSTSRKSTRYTRNRAVLCASYVCRFHSHGRLCTKRIHRAQSGLRVLQDVLTTIFRLRPSLLPLDSPERGSDCEV